MNRNRIFLIIAMFLFLYCSVWFVVIFGTIYQEGAFTVCHPLASRIPRSVEFAHAIGIFIVAIVCFVRACLDGFKLRRRGD